ncbi:DUF4112 domain-containing protein [Allosediminivita pacifica]|uniref:Uncharacterized protein DUF4112 n=1 Tax=Allosediminivita pacifica TaxID=1267769 RepID=A0A2T6AVC1_9RHOB|nr:DUF4112 domain-containing protein [Allosediminivita pacifica]PTX47764.1 uncharacterized protein DUF4112 [Allosediminivita pacifica]GGB13006.1 hypothetical protein GCM10011324_23970 [Allosediminivita pacifica]
MALHPDFEHVERAEKVARIMDNAFRVPGTRITLGWDAIIGLVPGVGDALALAPSLVVLDGARKTGASQALMGRMIMNLGIDWVVGLVPLIGDVLDVGYKANLRNAALLRAHVEARHRDGGNNVPGRAPFAHNGASASPGDRPAMAPR